MVRLGCGLRGSGLHRPEALILPPGVPGFRNHTVGSSVIHAVGTDAIEPKRTVFDPVDQISAGERIDADLGNPGASEFVERTWKLAGLGSVSEDVRDQVGRPAVRKQSLVRLAHVAQIVWQHLGK